MTIGGARRGALSGVVVLDLSRVLAGPWATQTLGDLGATVLKIERPSQGDDTRQWGPPFQARDDDQPDDAAYFFCANRNKRSVAIDFSKPKGADLLREMVRSADILVENFKVGGLAKYGLDYETLRAINPRLVYCSITGFGQTGPMAAQPGYDYMIQAAGGLMSITGQPDGEPGGEPLRTGVAVADLFTGLSSVNAILAALLYARETGEGQHIDMALFDVQVSMLANQASNYFVSGARPQRLGNAHPNLAPYQVFKTADGAMVIAVGNNGQFEALCSACGIAAEVIDVSFRTNSLRVANRAALKSLLDPILKSRTTAQWGERLEAAGVPFGPINSVDEVFVHPQAIARQLVVEQDKRGLPKPVRSVASPLRLSATPPAYALPPPDLGADTQTVLRERLGLSDAQMQDLADQGVIGGV
jgi:crotonobetainyl-CoA:carnitine CoA-transferase CaiB-like acyl-CoA transferase